MEGAKRDNPNGGRGARRNGAKERSGANLPLGETFVLQHAYRLARRDKTTSLYTAVEGTQLTFDRPVIARTYEPSEQLGLTAGALRRIRAVLARGGDGGFAVDVGEREDGSAFVVLRPPVGHPVGDWWAASRHTPETLAALGLGIMAAVDAAGPRRRVELTLDNVFVSDPPGGEGLPAVELYSIGEWPTRREVRDMTQTVTRDLVVGFPPECFASEEAADGALEEGEAADVYRVAAILYELSAGAHPVFRGGEVSEALAALVNDLAPPPRPVDTGDATLDALVLRALERRPGARPSWSGLRAGLAEVRAPLGSARGVEASEPGTSPPPGRSEERAARASRSGAVSGGSRAPWIVLGLAAGLLLGAVATFFWANQPPREVDIFITSQPTGTAFERVEGDGRVEPLGRTPLLLREQSPNEPIAVRPVYEDGERGETHTLVPELLEVIDACRGVHFAFGEGQ